MRDWLSEQGVRAQDWSPRSVWYRGYELVQDRQGGWEVLVQTCVQPLRVARVETRAEAEGLVDRLWE